MIETTAPMRRYLLPSILVALVGGISVLHYVTATQAIGLHEVFKRLYYVPIVIAAMNYGVRGGLAASLGASVLYLPHVAVDWRGWPAVEVERYAEVFLFNVVAILAGVLADRLRTERNRYRQTAAELRDAYAYLQVQSDERLRMDRLVTVGRLAAGLAHAIRNPLGGLLGCVEILEREFPAAHPRREFCTIARKEVKRLDGVVTEFLEFAEPAPPYTRPVDLEDLIHSVSRLAQVSLMEQNITCHVDVPGHRVLVQADREQLQRALLTLILTGAADLKEQRIHLRLHDGPRPSIVVTLDGADPAWLCGDELFEPFPSNGRAHGLALATARRLVHNQGGRLRADQLPLGLQFVLDLPAADVVSAPLSSPPHATASAK